MAGPPAGLGGEAVYVLGVQRRRLAGRQVVGQHDDRLAEPAHLLAALAEQLAEDALFQVEDVADALGHQAADVFQGLGVAAHDPADGVLGGEVLVADERLDLAAQGGVGEHDGVGAEDGAVLGPEAGADGVLALAGLAGRLVQGPAEAGDLGVALRQRHKALRDAVPLGVQHQGRADGHTRRDGGATFDFHAAARPVRERRRTAAGLSARQVTSSESASEPEA